MRVVETLDEGEKAVSLSESEKQFLDNAVPKRKGFQDIYRNDPEFFREQYFCNPSVTPRTAPVYCEPCGKKMNCGILMMALSEDFARNSIVYQCGHCKKEANITKQNLYVADEVHCRMNKSNTVEYIKHNAMTPNPFEEIEKRKNYEEVRFTVNKILREYNFSPQEYQIAEQYLHSCIDSGEVVLNTVEDYRKCLDEFKKKLEERYKNYCKGVSNEIK